jgi:hypothetical protein
MQKELDYQLTVNQELKMRLADMQKELDSLFKTFQYYLNV